MSAAVSIASSRYNGMRSIHEHFPIRRKPTSATQIMHHFLRDCVIERERAAKLILSSAQRMGQNWITASCNINVSSWKWFHRSPTAPARRHKLIPRWIFDCIKTVLFGNHRVNLIDQSEAQSNAECTPANTIHSASLEPPPSKWTMAAKFG